MSKEDAPKFRVLDSNSCFNCLHNENLELSIVCVKHGFYSAYMSNNAVCDSWEGE